MKDRIFKNRFIIPICFVLLIIPFISRPLTGENRALLVGIENYNHPAINLKGPVRDVKLMETIALTIGFRKSQIKTLVNNQATRSMIISAFKQWLIEGVRPEDKIFFYFSGHGTQVEDKDADENDGCDEALVPFDLFTGGQSVLITDDEMNVLFSRVKAGQKLIIIDSCHSGTATRDIQSLLQTVTVDGFSTYGKLLVNRECRCNQPVNKRSVLFFAERGGDRLDYISLTAADQDEIAQSSLKPGEGSVFSQTLYDVITEHGPGISFKELRSRVTKIVRQRCNRANIPLQTPQLEGNPAWYLKRVKDFGSISYNNAPDHLPARMPESPVKKKRTALVVGNGAYAGGKLKNAVNDARLMKVLLEKLNFDVIYGENLNLREMKKKLNHFSEKLKGKGGVGLFYFAGHGMQIKGQNYLLPIGIEIRDEADVEFECLPADRVISKMEFSRNRLNIIVLDACRNNPFVYSFNRSFSRGLAQMHSGKGMLIAYATAPGKIASDGPGIGNGLFTYYLVKTIEIPGLSLEKIFTITRRQVYEKSKQQQLPWISSSVLGEFIFKPAKTRSKSLPMDWQFRFEEKIEKLKRLDADHRISPASKKMAWEKLLAAFHQDDPYSEQDDLLREYIKERVEFWNHTDQFGYVIVTAIPYARLIIDGQDYGYVPPVKKIKLPVGKHQVILKNRWSVKRDIDIEPGKSVGVYQRFSRTSKEKK